MRKLRKTNECLYGSLPMPPYFENLQKNKYEYFYSVVGGDEFFKSNIAETLFCVTQKTLLNIKKTQCVS